MSARAALHVVASETADDVRTPEDVLGYLFTREAQLAGELAEVRAQLAGQRRRYAEAHGLRVFPAIDTLRRLFA